MKKLDTSIYILIILIFTGLAIAADTPETGIDAHVKAFLDEHRGQWHDMNIPAGDGSILYDLILKNKYTRVLEIGTSTGHSAIWMAWALSKTGGKLITIDIDKERHDLAVQNFKEAGVEQFIDARLGDAHEIVPALPGPFDFVFSDADKDWYTNYVQAVLPKLKVGGCFAAHNVSPQARSADIAEFWRFVTTHPELETTMADGDRSSISISYKRKSAQTDKK